MSRLDLVLPTPLTPDGRMRLDAAVQIHHLAKGALPIAKGESITGAYIVARGRLRVSAMSADGREATLYTIAPGETCVLAINALFKAVPYPANVVAEVATDVAFVPGQIWRSLFATEPAIQNLTLEALSVAVMRLMDQLESIHARPLRKRLIHLFNTRVSDDGIVRLTQAEIATELGTAREVVARHIADLRRSGLVTGKRGQIEFIRRQRLD